MNLKHKRIIINKINQIGDVTFSLPLASELKRIEPTCTIIFLACAYTKALLDQYADVDEFADWEAMSKNGLDAAIKNMKALKADIIIHIVPPSRFYRATYDVAKKAKIPIRIGTIGKLYSWLTCNRFVYIPRSRLPYHETQMDMLFLKKLGGKSYYSFSDIIQLRSYKPFQKTEQCLTLLHSKKFNLILHPKTRGEHIEWPLNHFAQLIKLLPSEQFEIFITGNAKEGDQVRDTIITPFSHVHDLCGKLSLAELLAFITNANGMICASTGPVHLAANLGIFTLGLYAPIKPLDASRWGPVGAKAEVLCVEKNCEDCRFACACHCIAEITPQQVQTVVLRWAAT